MKSRNQRDFLNIPKTRTELVELLLLIVIASLGVNLISALIAQMLGPYRAGLCGIIIILSITGYILFTRIFKKSFTNSINAVLSVKKQKNKLLNIRDYSFNFDFNMILHSLLTENKAFKSQWSDNPLGVLHDKPSEKNNESKSQKIVREISEYIYLTHLSTHLTDYFQNDSYDKKELVELNRNDVLDLLATNRVLEMISKDRSDREAFLKLKDMPKEEGEIVMSWANGALYNKFDLTLPKGSTISRQKDNSITIDCTSIKLNFKVDFKGFNANVSPLFEKHYMHQQDKSKPWDNSHYHVKFITTIIIKPAFIAFGRQLNYHQWAESFLETIEGEMSFSAFLDRINWDTIEAMIHTGKASINSKS